MNMRLENEFMQRDRSIDSTVEWLLGTLGRVHSQQVPEPPGELLNGGKSSDSGRGDSWTCLLGAALLLGAAAVATKYRKHLGGVGIRPNLRLDGATVYHDYSKAEWHESWADQLYARQFPNSTERFSDSMKGRLYPPLTNSSPIDLKNFDGSNFGRFRYSTTDFILHKYNLQKGFPSP